MDSKCLSPYFIDKYGDLPRPKYFQPGAVAPWANLNIDDRVIATQKLKDFIQSYSSINSLHGELSDRITSSAIEILGDNDISTEKSAVLVAFIEQDKQIESVIVMTRTMAVSTHKGQVSFPGGMVEENDKDVIDTALRETFEEIGIERSFFEIIGTHEPVSTRETINNITPVVALCKREVLEHINTNKGEVQELHVIAIKDLVSTDSYMSEIWDFGDFVTSINMYFVYDEQNQPVFIWGATAHILTNILRCLSAESVK